MKIFSLNKTNLSKNIISNFDVTNKDEDLKIDKFLDGELCPIFLKSIRGEEIFIISDGHSSEDIIKLLLTVDAAKRSGAKQVNVVYPYIPYSRSDKFDSMRTTIGSRLISNMLEKSGMDNLICMELHSDSISGFYSVPIIHLSSGKIFINYLKNLNLDNMCFTAPDAGASKRNQKLSKAFKDSINSIISKTRKVPNIVASMELIGTVDGKNVIIHDDIADSFGTISKASNLVMNNGALSCRAIIPHGVLSKGSLDNLYNSSLTELVITDSVNGSEEKLTFYNKNYPDPKPKFTIISCSDIISKSIDSLINKKSINELNEIN